jgi:hypothetical protein
MNYTLEVNSSLNREILASLLEPNAENFTLGSNLSNENILYTFRVLVANDMGIVPTSYRQFCKSLFFCLLLSSLLISLFQMQTPLMFKR